MKATFDEFSSGRRGNLYGDHHSGLALLIGSSDESRLDNRRRHGDGARGFHSLIEDCIDDSFESSR